MWKISFSIRQQFTNFLPKKKTFVDSLAQFLSLCAQTQRLIEKPIYFMIYKNCLVKQMMKDKQKKSQKLREIVDRCYNHRNKIKEECSHVKMSIFSLSLHNIGEQRFTLTQIHCKDYTTTTTTTLQITDYSQHNQD